MYIHILTDAYIRVYVYICVYIYMYVDIYMYPWPDDPATTGKKKSRIRLRCLCGREVEGVCVREREIERSTGAGDDFVVVWVLV